ncbi:hypothetical protein BDY24DRAFT_419464 [Mrakia frigida]|uniref:uncharacterized protein n=1 Tax=Mrakia frigida TaxID=29902 RepID=UPI003FCC1336
MVPAVREVSDKPCSVKPSLSTDLTFILAIVVFFCLADRPHVSKYLNEDERVIALTRLNSKNLGYAFTDRKTYAVSIAYSCMDLGHGSVSAYLPTIIKGLGNTDAEAQLYTVPPCAVSLIFMLMVTTNHHFGSIPAASDPSHDIFFPSESVPPSWRLSCMSNGGGLLNTIEQRLAILAALKVRIQDREQPKGWEGMREACSEN